MINPHEIVNQSQLMVEQRRRQSDMHRLAMIACDGSELQDGKTDRRGRFSQSVQRLLVQLRIVRSEASHTS